MKYIIMENHLSYSVALDEAGRFIKIANMGYDIGDLVQEVYEAREAEKQTTLKPLWVFSAIGLVAASFALFFFLNLGGVSAEPYAKVYLSINPAVCLSVDESGTVIDLSAVNDDGALLIDAYSFGKKNMNLVADELIARAIELGYLSEGGAVTIDIDSPNEQWFQTSGVMFRQNLNLYVTERLSLVIEIKPYDESSTAETAIVPEAEQEESSAAESIVLEASSVAEESSSQEESRQGRMGMHGGHNHMNSYNNYDDDDDDESDD